jgi:tRNA(Ile)-lysidine synthase
VIRPLIEVRRSEIERYVRRKHLTPRVDVTNTSDGYLRNRVRNELLPLLEKKYNSNIKETLSTLAQVAGYDYDYLQRSAEKAAGKLKRSVDLAWFLRQHPAIQRMSLRLAAENTQGNLRRLTFRHIREIEDMARNRPSGSVVDLPNGISVVKKQKTLSFRRASSKASS